MPLSTMQIGLAVLGGLLLLVMAVHAVWSARKNMPRQATPPNAANAPAGPVLILSPGWMWRHLIWQVFRCRLRSAGPPWMPCST